MGAHLTSAFAPPLFLTHPKSSGYKLASEKGFLVQVAIIKLFVSWYGVYMAFADSKCLDSKFSDSKYLDSKQKIKITYFWKKWEIFKDKILSFQ